MEVDNRIENVLPTFARTRFTLYSNFKNAFFARPPPPWRKNGVYEVILIERETEKTGAFLQGTYCLDWLDDGKKLLFLFYYLLWKQLDLAIFHNFCIIIKIIIIIFKITAKQ